MRISPADHWAKMHVTPLGVDPELFTPGPFRADFDVFEVICVGRLVPAKGQRVLIEAVAKLAAEGRASPAATGGRRARPRVPRRGRATAWAQHRW